MNFPFHTLYQSAPLLLPWGSGGGENKDLQCVLLRNHVKPPAEAVLRKCLSNSQKLLGKMSGRLTKGCMSCAPAK